jgi:hypothetical protein
VWSGKLESMAYFAAYFPEPGDFAPEKAAESLGLSDPEDTSPLNKAGGNPAIPAEMMLDPIPKRPPISFVTPVRGSGSLWGEANASTGRKNKTIISSVFMCRGVFVQAMYEKATNSKASSGFWSLIFLLKAREFLMTGKYFGPCRNTLVRNEILWSVSKVGI